jgi:hypothetical protein
MQDNTLQFFSEIFYQSMPREQRLFGRVIHQARCQTYETFPDYNIRWAFQAYGDPVL